MKHALSTLFVIFLGLAIGGTGSYVGFYLLAEDAQTYDEVPDIVSEGISESTGSAETDRAIGGMVDAAHAGESGTIISGEETAPYKTLDPALYEEALSNGSIIVLYFCSDTDPICQVESPDIAEGFDKLTVSNVVGFHIPYGEEIMTAYEKELVTSFEIDSQHNKLVLVDGEEVLRSTDAWTTPRFVEAITKLVSEQ
ncbi:hypothetical protein HY469_05675 [Candidatus Roizmanbacteria bacterium]|nr:hypothetical protein [Candidatus Roizmanbacteria bacterium]